MNPVMCAMTEGIDDPFFGDQQVMGDLNEKVFFIDVPATLCFGVWCTG